MSDPTRDISGQVPFLHLCTLFERMSKAKSAMARKKSLRQFVDQYTRMTRNYYPVLRLMAPECDFSRVYGIKERTLAHLMLDVYGISPSSADGKRLLQWREGEGDLPSVIYSLVLARSTVKSRWTLQDVNCFLAALASCSGMEERKHVFRQVVSKLHAQEVKWLCKIILKKLRYGTSLPPLLEAFCPKASDLYTFRAHLEHVCLAIQDPTFCIEDAMSLELFVPFQPMLSARNKPLDIPKTMDPPYYVETKYDGERVLVHVQKRKTRIFSRYLQDSTSLYTKIIQEIRFALDSSVKSCILDGELLVWDEEQGCVEPFGGARAIATAGQKENQKHFFFKIFDILHLNGDSLLQHALYERKEKLHALIQETPTRVETVKHVECDTIEEVVALFRQATQEKEEGVVVKNPRSPYMPNIRSKDAWVKLKPDFVSNIATDLDVLIVGAYYGEGKKTTGTLYSYLIGVRNKDASEFYPVGKVATGLSDRERAFLLDELKDDWVCECPINIAPGVDVPDVWIAPEDSVILEVRAMQIIPCEKRPSGVTFRCPRIEKLRLDKEFDTGTMTLERLQGLIRETAMLQEHGLKSPTKKKSRKKERKPLTTPTNVENVEVVSTLFSGCTFVVCGGAWEKKQRKALETLIHAHGGTFYQNYTPRVQYVIAEKSNTQLKNILYEIQKQQKWLREPPKYEHLRVQELKELLRQRFLKVSGRRAELIARLREKDATMHVPTLVKPKWLIESTQHQKRMECTEDNAWC